MGHVDPNTVSKVMNTELIILIGRQANEAGYLESFLFEGKE